MNRFDFRIHPGDEIIVYLCRNFDDDLFLFRHRWDNALSFSENVKSAGLEMERLSTKLNKRGQEAAEAGKRLAKMTTEFLMSNKPHAPDAG